MYKRLLPQCIEVLGKGCLTEELMQQVMSMLEKHLKQHFERQDQRQGEYSNIAKHVCQLLKHSFQTALVMKLNMEHRILNLRQIFCLLSFDL